MSRHHLFRELMYKLYFCSGHYHYLDLKSIGLYLISRITKGFIFNPSKEL